MKAGEKFLVLAGLCLVGFIGLSEKTAAGPFRPVALEPKDLLQVKIHKLTLDPASMQPVVFLTDSQEERVLPIWIGPCEANAMNAEMEGTPHPRPLTHDLAVRIIQKFKAKVQRIIITHTKDGIYYATLVLEKQGSVMEIDARPSDSMVLALKSKAPIFVSKALFAEMSLPLREPKGIEENYGLTIQDLTPSLAQSFSYKSSQGVLVSEVRSGSSAEKDGLQQGDILVEVGEETVPDTKSLRAALAKSKGPVKAKIFRKGGFLSVILHVR